MDAPAAPVRAIEPSSGSAWAAGISDPLEERIAGLFAVDRVAVRVARNPRASEWIHQLLPEERSCIARAVEGRRREFAAGRAAARAALAALGAPAAPLVPDRDRVPRWPLGFVGSLSHTRRLCVAAAARRHPIASLGLDVEEMGPLPLGVTERVCRAAERARLAAWSERAGTSADKIVFSAKEAVFKAYFPVTRHFLEFEDVSIDLDPEAGSFQATLLPAAAPRVGRRPWIEGRFCLVHAHVISAVLVADEPSEA